MKEKKKKNWNRERRYFSEEFRKARVKELEEGRTKVSEICSVYKVSSSAVYKWLRKYSSHYKKAVIKVVELKSETAKRKHLEEKLTHLEQLVGQKQIEIEYLSQLITIAEEHYGIDIKKNLKKKR